MTSKTKKIIISSLISVIFIVGGVFAIYKTLSNNEVIDNSNNPPKTQLKQTTNISYDTQTNLLTWDEVDHANLYEVDINGKTEKTETNSFYYVPLTKTSEIKVKAYDTTGYYTASDWSAPFVYTVPEKQISLSAVSTFVNDMLPANIQLQKIISIHPEGNNLHTSAVFKKGSKNYLYELETTYDHNVSSLKDAMSMENVMTYTGINKSYEIADYNSAEYLLKSDEYAGQMEEYKQAGYEFSVVSSQAFKMDDVSLGISSTFKLDNGITTKYVQSEIICGVPTTPIESMRYTTSLKNISPEDVSIDSFVELTGDFAEFAQMLDNNYSASTQTVYDQDSIIKLSMVHI